MDIKIEYNTEEEEKNTEYVQYMTTEHERMVISGYRKSNVRTTFAYIGVALTAGLLYLWFHWQPRWRLIATHTKCNLATATKLLILETFLTKFKSYRIKDVHIKHMNSETPTSYENDGYNTDDSVERTETNSYTLYLEDGSCKNVMSYRFFRNKKIVFVWDESSKCFLRMVGMEKSASCTKFHSMPGYSTAQQSRIRGAYGENEIQVPIQSILMLLVLEFFNPFYMFQVFTIIVWVIDKYYYYSGAIVLMSIFGISTTIIQTRKNQANLKSTVQSVGDVQVCRDRATGVVEDICSADLVPGDIILIPPSGCTMHVDAVLLDGSCIVNESMLTGESVPVTKTALPNQNRPYDIKEDSNHTLYCGTKVIQTRYYKNEPVRAVVLRTGFLTTKGQLVRSIMYPLPADFKFDRDSYKFIFILVVISLLGLIYTVLLKSGRNFTPGDIIIKSLDIITIVIPPALPAAMTVGRLYAISRLKRSGVFCINPRVINVCGSISCVCFDKTGTLTEDGLDMWGIIPARLTRGNNVIKDNLIQRRKSSTPSNKSNADNQDREMIEASNFINDDEFYRNISDNELDDGVTIQFGAPIRDPSTMNDQDLMKIGMNVCHSLTILDNEVTGDPLDVKMFESTGWILEEPKVPDNTKFDLLIPTVVRSPVNDENATSSFEWGIVQQYQFNSSLQRCSVISKAVDSSEYMAFCKGSPEMIAALSRPETVPHNIKSSLRHYTQQGYRVLALGCRRLPQENFLHIQKLTREEVETDLTFLGLVVMENRLKPESTAVINELLQANIKVVMITGDNLDTAVSVAAECGLLLKGEKLILCETVPALNKLSPPELYYTSSMINIEGLKKSKTNTTNVPSVARISTKDIANLDNLDTALSIPSTTTSSSSINTIENGIANKNYKIAMTGATWGALREHYSELIPKLITRGAVFARMSSEQKQQLVQELQALGYYVAMCGDGANDCGALKTAHVGISVSGQESSVASPFTSRDGHVGCVPLVVKEGRAALITSFGMFKFMVCYSLMEFFSVAMLYYSDINLTDFQFLFIDIILILNFAFSFGKTHSYPGKLGKKRPGTSLLGFIPLFSVASQVILSALMQISSFLILRSFDWYVPHVPQGDMDYYSHENYSIFAVTMFHFITIAVAFSHGKPYRKLILTNWVLMLSLLITTLLCVYIALYPAVWLQNLLELKLPPDFTFRYVILILGAIHFVISMTSEKIVVQYMMQEKEFLPKRLRENFPKSNSYHSIEKELVGNADWPPVTAGQTHDAINNTNEAKVNGNLNKNACNGNYHKEVVANGMDVPESIVDNRKNSITNGHQQS